MGRKNNYPARGPRSSLIANHEVRRALRGHRPAAFGIRRLLDEQSREETLDVTFDLQEAGDIPEKVELRDYLGVTLLSQRVIGRQLQRGVLAGYNLGRTGAMIAHSDACRDQDETLEVNRGAVRVFNQRVIFAAIESPELEGEINDIYNILGSVGIQGIARTEKPLVPHLTLGESMKGKALSITEQRHIIHTLDEELPDTFNVEPWDIYPYNVFQTGRH